MPGENVINNVRIQLNNADDVLKKFSSQTEEKSEGLFLTMVQGNTYCDVTITSGNLKNNADFIVDLWD